MKKTAYSELVKSCVDLRIAKVRAQAKELLSEGRPRELVPQLLGVNDRFLAAVLGENVS